MHTFPALWMSLNKLFYYMYSWWTKWHWSRLFSEIFGFSLLIIIPPLLHANPLHEVYNCTDQAAYYETWILSWGLHPWPGAQWSLNTNHHIYVFSILCNVFFIHLIFSFLNIIILVFPVVLLISVYIYGGWDPTVCFVYITSKWVKVNPKHYWHRSWDSELQNIAPRR